MEVKEKITIPRVEECETCRLLRTNGWILETKGVLPEMQGGSGEVIVERQLANRRTPFQNFAVRENYHLHLLELQQAIFVLAGIEKKRAGDEFFFFTHNRTRFARMACAKVDDSGVVVLEVGVSPPLHLEEGQSFLYVQTPRRS